MIGLKILVIGIVLLIFALLPEIILSIAFGPNPDYQIITKSLALLGLCLFGLGTSKLIFFPQTKS